jgi:hypothetical protein
MVEEAPAKKKVEGVQVKGTEVLAKGIGARVKETGK